jgi:hypothetical protein
VCVVSICQELPTWSLGDEFHFQGDELQPKNLIFFTTLCEWIASKTNQTLYLHGRGGEIRNRDLTHISIKYPIKTGIKRVICK